MNSPVEKIKERLSIEEVVSSYIKLERSGANFKARCPFHNEKTPSFFISPSRNSYYCFGCGASGDIFTFVEEFEGLDFKGALKLLADKAGVPLEAYTPAMKEAESEKEKLYRAMEDATKYYENNLKDSPEVLEYLKARGLTEKSITDFRIGYIKNDWRLLYEFLKNKFADAELEKAGLIKKTEKGYYDRFRGRIMFPIADSSGRIIAFSGRIFDDLSTSSGQVAQAKYLNSPETPIFSKNAVLYGLDKAKESIRKNNFSILVEGQMDLVLSHQAGYKNTIATSGTALSDSTVSKENVVSNLGLIRRLSENIVLAFDGDKAGFNASNRAGRIALSLGMDVKVAALPEGKDPADLISKEGSDAWRDAIKNSKHIIEFLLDKAIKNGDGDMRKAGRVIKETILSYVDALESSIEKMHFIKKISDQSGIPQNALQADLQKIEQELKYEKVEIAQAEESIAKMYRKDYIERRLAGIAFWKQDPALEAVLKRVLEKYLDIKNDLIFEAEVFYQNSDDLSKEISNLLGNWEAEKINEELSQKMQELRMVKDRFEESKLLAEIQELNKKKHEKKEK
jgi:DNA primase